MAIFEWFRKPPTSSGFGFRSTAEQVTQGVDGSGLTAVVTGASSGIGKETARVLALRGVKVIIPVRKLDSGSAAKKSILEQNPNAKIDVMEMDLASLKSVESFVHTFQQSNQPLNILINNAGIMACPFSLSEDGIELQFATNHVAHFLLTNMLLDKIKNTAKETGIQGRIVNVSSRAHHFGDPRSLCDLNRMNDPSKYNAYKAYANSKLANLLHSNELARQLQEEGANITANSLHPGIIVTPLFRFFDFKSPISSAQAVLGKPFFKTIPQGASTTCYLALHPNLKDVSGKHFLDCNEGKSKDIANGMELGMKLWDHSLDLVNKFKNSA